MSKIVDDFELTQIDEVRKKYNLPDPRLILTKEFLEKVAKEFIHNPEPITEKDIEDLINFKGFDYIGDK